VIARVTRARDIYQKKFDHLNRVCQALEFIMVPRQRLLEGDDEDKMGKRSCYLSHGSELTVGLHDVSASGPGPSSTSSNKKNAPVPSKSQ
jgi:hypothetical protein